MFNVTTCEDERMIELLGYCKLVLSKTLMQDVLVCTETLLGPVGDVFSSMLTLGIVIVHVDHA